MAKQAKTLNIVALIPARSGSRRLRHKNIRRLNHHPAIAYTISGAVSSLIFADIVVSTDSPQYADIAKYYGAEVPFLRPAKMATATSPDIEWITFTLKRLRDSGRNYDCFAILRPTSPFRKAETIVRAWSQFLSNSKIDSLRAVEPCKQHPGKMWVLNNDRMAPLLNQPVDGPPFHSQQYASLPPIYVQNASLEISWCRNVLEHQSISGEIIMPFLTGDYEGEDLNDERDWFHVERLVKANMNLLPNINNPPFPE